MEVKYKTIEESKKAYKEYCDTHIANVMKAFKLVGDEILAYRDKALSTGKGFIVSRIVIKNHLAMHDMSKYSDKEFEAYRKMFYCSDEDIRKSGVCDNVFNDIVEEEFEKAWAHHIKKNKHHPEHWLKKDSETKEYEIIPTYSFVEMICDWISVSMTNKSSVYDWWFNSDSGRKEKKDMIALDSDIDFIDNLIITNKDKLDFSI